MVVDVNLGNIFDGGVDLTILPCSAKPSVSRFTQNWIDQLGLVDPVKDKLSLQHGDISPLFEIPEGRAETRYYVYAAAVLNDYSSSEIVMKLAEKIGLLTQEHKGLRVVECVLLGTGAGELSNIVSARALKGGFEKTAHKDARLIIYSSNTNIVRELKEALSQTFIERLASRIKLSPALFGVGFNFDKDFRHFLKKISRRR